jgi:RNA polymerase sigma-B factor
MTSTTAPRPRGDALPLEQVSSETSVVLTPEGPRGPGSRLSHGERAARTRELLEASARTSCAATRDRLLDEVVGLNCRVADAVATRYRDRGVALDDLRQAAYIGLVRAVRAYDPQHADDLLTYAVPSIRGEVQRHFRDRAWMVRPPRRVQDLQRQVNQAIDELQDLLGREPTEKEVRARVGVDADTYAEVVGAFGCLHPTSLDRPVGEDDGLTMGELLADRTDDLGHAEARCVLAPVLARLDPLDRRLLQLRFYDELSQREVGQALGLTQTQVSRHLHRVLGELRAMVGTAPDPDTQEPRAIAG